MQFLDLITDTSKWSCSPRCIPVLEHWQNSTFFSWKPLFLDFSESFLGSVANIFQLYSLRFKTWKRVGLSTSHQAINPISFRIALQKFTIILMGSAFASTADARGEHLVPPLPSMTISMKASHSEGSVEEHRSSDHGNLLCGAHKHPEALSQF